MAGQLAATLAFLGLCLGCSTPHVSHPSHKTPFHPPHKRQEKPMVDTSHFFTDSAAGLPDSLRSKTPLWESSRRGGGPRPTLTQTRLYDNGELYSWSETRRVRENGKPTRTPAPAAWRLDAKVNPAGIQEVKSKLSTDFMSVPAEGPANNDADRGTVAWRTRSGGKTHMVVRPASATSDLPPAIRAIETAIQSHIVSEGVPWEQPE